MKNTVFDMRVKFLITLPQICLLLDNQMLIFLLLVEGFQSWMWRGLGFVIPFLIVAYVSINDDI